MTGNYLKKNNPYSRCRQTWSSYEWNQKMFWHCFFRKSFILWIILQPINCKTDIWIILDWKAAAAISVFIQSKTLQHRHQQNSKWSESAYYLEKWYACPVKVLIWHIYNKLFNDEQWSVVNKLNSSWYFGLQCHKLSNKWMCWRSRKRKKSLREQDLRTSFSARVFWGGKETYNWIILYYSITTS